MSISQHVRRTLVDSPNSLGARARSRRWQLISELFPDLADMNVIDLGGTVQAWQRAPVRPFHVTVLNLFEPGYSDEPWLDPVQGDACAALHALEQNARGTTYDIVFSNAVIEHVGGHANRSRFAASVQALAPMHWVQTPYRYFPLEPHWLFPGMQFLPVTARVQIAERWPLVHTRPDSVDEARSAVLWTELIGLSELRGYFPASTIMHEKVAGLTKSIIAVQQGTS